MGKGSGTGSRSSVKMWGSGTSLSLLERKNANLRNELDPFWAWKCVSPERPRTRGAAERFAFGLSRPWEAINGFKLKKFWKLWSPERQNPPKNLKWWCSRTDFFGNLWKWYAPERIFLVICENDMLRNGNSGLKMGVSLAAHTQYAYIWKYPPPPPGTYYVTYWFSNIILFARGKIALCRGEGRWRCAFPVAPMNLAQDNSKAHLSSCHKDICWNIICCAWLSRGCCG